MKNVKRLSRQELKTMLGGANIDGPIYVACAKNYKWCANLNKCLPVGSNCDLKPYDPTTGGGL